MLMLSCLWLVVWVLRGEDITALLMCWVVAHKQVLKELSV